MFKFLKKNITIFHIISLLIVCYFTKSLLESDSVAGTLVLPGLLWGFLFFLFNMNLVKDKTFAGIGFITSNLVLWPLLSFIGGTIGMMLHAISPIFGFSLIGGLAAFCAYYLFSMFLLPKYSSRQALISFAIGCISFAIILFLFKGSIEISYLIFGWELLVGSGLIYFRTKNQGGFS